MGDLFITLDISIVVLVEFRECTCWEDEAEFGENIQYAIAMFVTRGKFSNNVTYSNIICNI